MNVVFVMLIHLMIVLKTVLEFGVEILLKMHVVHVVVMVILTNVVFVMLMRQMTANKIVQMFGVVIQL